MNDTIHILFVCHGNICRSPMAQFVLTDLLDRAGHAGDFLVDSAAVSSEELGNTPHPGAIRVLRAHGVPLLKHHARTVRRSEYQNWDYIVYMDAYNLRWLRRIFGGDPDGKLSSLLSWAGRNDDVADPWYTGDFETTYQDVLEGCRSMLEKLLQER